MNKYLITVKSEEINKPAFYRAILCTVLGMFDKANTDMQNSQKNIVSCLNSEIYVLGKACAVLIFSTKS